MQNLAPGSRWIDGKNEISDCHGYYISSNRPGKITVKCIESGDAYTVSSDDILAVIDPANLDPVRVAARKLVEMCTSGLLQSEHNRREVARLAKELKAIL